MSFLKWTWICSFLRCETWITLILHLLREREITKKLCREMWTKVPLGGDSIIELVISFWFAYILKTNSSYCSWTTLCMVHSCSSWNNVLIKFYSVKECHHQNAFEHSEKDNLKKQVKDVKKISLSNALQTTITTTKKIPTKITTATTRTVVMTVLRTNMHTGTESVQNKGDRSQSCWFHSKCRRYKTITLPRYSTI